MDRRVQCDLAACGAELPDAEPSRRYLEPEPPDSFSERLHNVEQYIRTAYHLTVCNSLYSVIPHSITALSEILFVCVSLRQFPPVLAHVWHTFGTRKRTDQMICPFQFQRTLNHFD